jgi:hypothetical protein
MIEEVKPEKNKIVNKKATKKKAKGEEKWQKMD